MLLPWTSDQVQGYQASEAARRFWWSILRATCPRLACARFFFAHRRYVGERARCGIDHQYSFVVLAGQKLENTIENPHSGPRFDDSDDEMFVNVDDRSSSSRKAGWVNKARDIPQS